MFSKRGPMWSASLWAAMMTDTLGVIGAAATGLGRIRALSSATAGKSTCTQTSDAREPQNVALAASRKTEHHAESRSIRSQIERRLDVPATAYGEPLREACFVGDALNGIRDGGRISWLDEEP